MAENVRSLRAIRMDLGISREKLARKTDDLSTGTIRNAEVGKHRITLDKASRILQAVNVVLAEMQKPTLDMADLGLRLY